MKLFTILSFPIFIIAASGSNVPRQVVTDSIGIRPPPPPTTTPTPTPTLIDIKTQEFPSWTSSVNSFQTTSPIPAGDINTVISQTNWISSYRQTQNLPPQKILDILKKISTTTYCAVYDYGININIEAILFFANKACQVAFPSPSQAYLIPQNSYYTYAYCSPPTTGSQPNTRVARCINFNLNPLYVQNADKSFYVTSQGLCKAAYAKSVVFCAKEIWEGRFIASATELSGNVNFAVNVYENFLPQATN